MEVQELEEGIFHTVFHAPLQEVHYLAHRCLREIIFYAGNLGPTFPLA